MGCRAVLLGFYARLYCGPCYSPVHVVLTYQKYIDPSLYVAGDGAGIRPQSRCRCSIGCLTPQYLVLGPPGIVVDIWVSILGLIHGASKNQWPPYRPETVNGSKIALAHRRPCLLCPGTELRLVRMLSRLAHGIRNSRVPAAVSGAFRNSFTTVEEATPRLNRCELYVPGTQAKIIPKAAKSAADVVVMDLEDSVAVGEKEIARKNVIQALREVDFGKKTVAVRINGLYSHHMYRDVVDIIEQAGERCDMFVIPMVGNGKDVYMADSLVSQVEEFMGRKKKIGFGLIIEATMGMMNIHEIAAASKRNESLHFGVADYAASTKSRTTNIGGPNKLYGVLTDKDGDTARDFFWGDPWHYAMARIVVGARANGLRPVDGPFGDIADPDGYKAQCERGAGLGMEGKWAIHPSQVALANEVFSPGEAEVKQARRVLEAMEKAQKEGLGAVSLDGKLVDIASIKQADAIVKKAEAIEAM